MKVAQPPATSAANAHLAETMQPGCEADASCLLAQHYRPAFKKLKVYQSRPASDPIAGWTRELLAPVFEILKVEGRPVEFRSTGRYGGWSPSDRELDPERRIKLSNLVLFQSKASFVRIYVHELAHALIEDAEMKQDKTDESTYSHQHNPAFYCLNLYLYRLLDKAGYMADSRFKGDVWTNRMSLYDLQDPPLFYLDQPATQWLPLSINWIIETVEELMLAELSAEAAAEEVVKRYWAWTDSHFMQAERDEDAKQKQLETRALREQKLALMKSDLQLFRWLSGLFGLGFLTLFYYLLKA